MGLRAIYLPLVGLLTLPLLTACQKEPRGLPIAESLQCGEEYLLAHDYDAAIVQFLAVIEIAPMNPRGYTGTASAYIGMGEYVKASDLLQQGLALLPNEKSIQLLLDALADAEASGESVPSIALDVPLSNEQRNMLLLLEAEVLEINHEDAHAIMASPAFRSLCASVSAGEPVSYKSDETGCWQLRCITAETAPDCELDAAFSNCSMGVRLTDGQTLWADYCTSSSGFDSTFWSWDDMENLILSLSFDGQAVT